MRAAADDPSAFAAPAPHAASYSLRRRDGLALLHWLLDPGWRPWYRRMESGARELG